MKIHRDRPSDDVQTAKDSPPLRGWPEKWTGANIPRMFAAYPGDRRPVHAGGGETLNRAVMPAFRASPIQPASPANPGHPRPWTRTLGVMRRRIHAMN